MNLFAAAAWHAYRREPVPQMTFSPLVEAVIDLSRASTCCIGALLLHDVDRAGGNVGWRLYMNHSQSVV